MSEAKLQEPVKQVTMQPLPQLHSLPALLPLEGAVRIELDEEIRKSNEHSDTWPGGDENGS